jgi:two-component system sensor histidine kinase/response regulator
MLMSDPASSRILIVDDEVSQMKALCDTLGDHGYEAVGFTTGEAALGALRETQFELILTDLMMPGMDGIALLRAALDRDPNLVGILMTGQGTIDTAVDAMKTGALDYILKPFKLSIILPVLSRALAVRRLRMENAELEARVRDRTAELEATNKELDAFSFSVSHDLRAPLRAVHAFSNILLEEHAAEMSGEAQRLLTHVMTNAQHMERLVEGLLRLSRLGRQPLSQETVDIAALVRDVLDEQQREQGDRSVEVRLGDLPACLGDLSLLKQVFVNLLSNAFKFTCKKGDAVVEVGSRAGESGPVYFVRDNGAGFDMTYADRLFGVFQRLHRAEDFEGTGIGLSIVQRIVQRHSGRIWAEAEPDRGATFLFTLPAPVIDSRG